MITSRKQNFAHFRVNTRPRRSLGQCALSLLLPGLLALFGSAPGLIAANVTLGWTAPTQNADGTPLTNLAGYKLYYGTASHTYSTNCHLGLVTSATVTNLQAGTTYFFATTACDTAGNESGYSPEVTWSAPVVGTLDHFAWGPIASAQTVGVPFTVSVTAQDAKNGTVASFAGTVKLSGSATASAAIGTGTGVSGYPMATSYEKAREQVIYLTNEVGQAGWISALALNVATAPHQTLKNWTIRMKPTGLSQYSSKSQWESNGWTTVYQQDTGVTSTGWVSFALSTPFYYNGTSNLMVDFTFDNTNYTSAGACRFTTVSANRQMCNMANWSFGNPLNWSGSTPNPNLAMSIPNVRLQFASTISIAPTTSGTFANGIWTGSITVLSAATGVALKADDGSGQTGVGNTFNVAAAKMAAAPAKLLAVNASSPSVSAAAVSAATAKQLPSMSIALQPVSEGASGVVLRWSSVAGTTYMVQRSTGPMAAPLFADLAQVTAQGPVTVYTDTTATGTGFYLYRLRLEP